MPSQQYEPPKRDDASALPDQAADQRPDRTVAMPAQGDPASAGRLTPPASDSSPGSLGSPGQAGAQQQPAPTERTPMAEGQSSHPAYGGGTGGGQSGGLGSAGQQQDRGGYPGPDDVAGGSEHGGTAARHDPESHPPHGDHGDHDHYGDRSGQSYDPDRSDAGQYDPNRSDAAGYDPNRSDTTRYDPNSSDPAGYDPNRYDPNRYDPSRPPDGAAAMPADSDSVRAREKEAFGGVKVGAAFFGWLTAVGATVILVALVAAVASAFDLGTVVGGETSSQDLRSVGIGAAVAVLVVLFLAYYCGGYVAGRMARFNGVRQGIAVWLWAVLIAAVITGIGLLVDDVGAASDLNLPNLPVDGDDLTSTGLIALAIVLAVTLIGAILGGLAGMRFHRRVDRAGFAPDPY